MAGRGQEPEAQELGRSAIDRVQRRRRAGGRRAPYPASVPARRLPARAAVRGRPLARGELRPAARRAEDERSPVMPGAPTGYRMMARPSGPKRAAAGVKRATRSPSDDASMCRCGLPSGPSKRLTASMAA